METEAAKQLAKLRLVRAGGIKGSPSRTSLSDQRLPGKRRRRGPREEVSYGEELYWGRRRGEGVGGITLIVASRAVHNKLLTSFRVQGRHSDGIDTQVRRGHSVCEGLIGQRVPGGGLREFFEGLGAGEIVEGNMV